MLMATGLTPFLPAWGEAMDTEMKTSQHQLGGTRDSWIAKSSIGLRWGASSTTGLEEEIGMGKSLQQNQLIGREARDVLSLFANFLGHFAIRVMPIRITEAKDIFEVKVEILRIMLVIDPTGDYLEWGTRDLKNLRTATVTSTYGFMRREIDRNSLVVPHSRL
uniref:DUF8018 domain-containing protein n=1 Tax=Solanum lycopersicum TaxID=4081 RepID=K4CTH3_SOLLC